MSSSENSSIPSSDSSSTSTSSSSAAGSSTIDDSAANLLPAAPSDGGGAGAGDGIAENGDIIIPIYRGAGLAEHASVLDFILTLYGIQQHPTYTHSLEHDSLQSGFASDDSGASEILRKLAASCSMYRYFQRLHDMQPNVPQADIDMITSLFGKAIGQNPEQMKAALSGQPFGQTNADGFTQSITDAGCAANPYVYMPTTDAQGNGVNEVPPSQNFTNPLLTPEHPLSLHIEDRSTDTELAFAIVNDQGETFRDYGYSHGEEMHLIIWRNDLQHFYHIHPQHDALGLWRLPFTPDAGGSYWIYTNFVDQHGNAYAFPLSRTYAGDTGPIGIVPDAGMVKIIGGYQVELMPAKTPQGMSFAFKITDAKGQAVHLQKFLGAKGHLFMISTSGYFLHTHPATDANNLVFYTAALPVGFYRVTVQFQVDKEVETLSFDWAQ